MLRDSSLRILALRNLDGSKPKPGEGLTNGHVNGHIDGINGIYSIPKSGDLFQYPSHSIAIVGMAGRFSGADSVDELWDLIMEGKTMVEPAPVEPSNLP